MGDDAQAPIRGSGPGSPGPLDPAALGFAGDEASGWTRQLRGATAWFRLLRTLDDLLHAERLQEEVFGVTEHDLIPANELIVVPETGGAVVAAFLPVAPDVAAGVLVGWGGFVGKPRVVSDFLAVRPEARNLGLAAELKRLQAAIALARGFQEIVWTVDPLRAANARLNFGKLGAVARDYEIDRYGAGFAAGLYGGMPSDRLHVTWEIASDRVHDRLLGSAINASPSPAEIPSFQPGSAETNVAIAIPRDIDDLLDRNPEQARAWRLTLRQQLMAAFAEGFAITGFLPATSGDLPAYLLERAAGAAPEG
ncbi:MAG: GNAT family N-acetyltransferase [Thermomicrobiales bacterium]|nr:GNAT family N-acetyltransferase [Thermomicrobiales bacterium]